MSTLIQNGLAQSVGTVEYADCTSAEEWNLSNKCPWYDTKPSDGKAPFLEL